MNVSFREFNAFDLWIWVGFETAPSEQEKQYLEEVFNSWFFLGKLGGFDAENLQVQDAGVDLSYMPYNEATSDTPLMALMHNMGEFEYEGYWCRIWVDLGTSDAIALDVLINTLKRFSQDFVQIQDLIIGGENPDWPVEDRANPLKMVDDGED